MADINELEKFQNRQANDSLFMQRSLRELLSVVVDDLFPGRALDADNHLFEACKLVCENLDIKLKDKIDRVEELDSVDKIADKTGIKYRKVALDDRWWKTDSGPMVGFLEENQPVAILPAGSTAYKIYNPDTLRELIVDEEKASQIKPFAYTFYRSFSDKSLSLFDILRFGIASCWKSDFVLLILAGMLGGLLGLALPKATGIIYDIVIPESETGQIFQIGFLLLVAITTRALFQLLRSFVSLRLKTTLNVVLQSAIWDRLLRLPVPFFRKYSAGELAKKAMGINKVRDLLSDVMISSLLSGIFSMFFYIQMLLYSVKLTMGATVLILLAVVVTIGLGLLRVKYSKKLLDIENKLSGFLMQMIHGINKIKVAGAEKRLFYQWAEKFSRQRKTTFHVHNYDNYLEAFNAGFPVLSYMVIFYIMARGQDSMNVGHFVAFNAALVAFQTAVLTLSETFIELVGVFPLLENAKPILETIPEYHSSKPDPGSLTGRIEVDHVKFRYNMEDSLVLDDVSLQIGSEEYVAFVGPSGSGKSTLLRLLLGFEIPESGRIYYDHNDLTEVDIRAIRQQIGVVLQDGDLMAGTIYTNIAGNNPDLTRDDAWEAAGMAGLAEDINKMPMKMETIINPGQLTLSGGQKQRLLIARAIVKKPKILIFDEATSALDNKTQNRVTSCLDKLNATRIVIAHRLSTIKKCGCIFVLAGGKIREQGSYQSLVDQNGIFTRLAKRQMI